MKFVLRTLSISVGLGLISQISWADRAMTVLPTITITAQPLTTNISDSTLPATIVSQEQLVKGAATLGLALTDQAGVHVDTFGGGASRPIIRGQTAPRVQVLLDGSSIMDASNISPDHAVTVDPLLANRIEILNGPATLLYGSGAIGGVINVLDDKVPTKMPDGEMNSQVGIRFDTSANEKVLAAKTTVGIGSSLAVHFEGISRNADDYHTSEIAYPTVKGTYAGSDSGSVGFSWIGDRGYTGLAYTYKHDDYGLAGDADEYSICSPNQLNTQLICDISEQDTKEEEKKYLHHGDSVSWVRLNSKRLDLRSEYDDPFNGFSHLKLRASYTDYQHDEVENGEAATSFKNKGYDTRIELTHQPIANFNGVIGVQYNHSDFSTSGAEAFLPETLTNNIGAFLLEQYQWQDVNFELGMRHEWQRITPSQDIGTKFSTHSSNLNATSLSSAAKWAFVPDYNLILSLAHSERLPNAQELYAHGAHFATTTYELGNPDLGKETSNNVELSLRKVAGDLTFKLGAYHNQVNDYIYANTLDQYKNFRLIQYTASDVTFNGLEGEACYQFNPHYAASLFGDYVRAKLNNRTGEEANLPRIPNAKIGVRLDTTWDALSTGLEWVHQFQQDNIAQFETVGKAYDLFNVSLGYQHSLGKNTHYRAYLQLNNLLDTVYYNHSSFLPSIPMQGRNLVAGIQFNF